MPYTTPFDVSVVAPVPPLATGKVPVTPVVNGRPVTLVITPDVGVPRRGVTKVGLVANTKAPVPVSFVTAAATSGRETARSNVQSAVRMERGSNRSIRRFLK